nr:ankyrin repeat-containing protein ITN1-like [Ziziphus jujuba var. spinosa]
MAKYVDHELYKNFKDMYEGLMKGDMKKVLKQYDKLVPLPDYLTVFGDTFLHIAIFMDHEDIAREILKRYVDNQLYDLIHQKNNLGNTVLHEVATTNMVTLARDLLDYAPKLLSSKNNVGEMPLFKAAYNGQHDMFDVLSLAVNLTDKDNLDQHLTSKDRTNILHLTILAEFFDLAFIIARKYPHLIDKIDEAGKIGLQLLSNNPSAFLNSRNYGLLKRLIFKYYLQPGFPTFENIKEKEGYKKEDQKDSYQLDSIEDEELYNPKTKGYKKWPPTYNVFMRIASGTELLKDAQSWIKQTSESCSTIAVFIASVAFVAAYTIPGGSDKKTGVPILLHNFFFTVFAVMDVLSLISSLILVVLFLSILTSPFELQDFRNSLPRKLTFGFTFLFISVAVTMLAFAATIILVIHLKKH